MQPGFSTTPSSRRCGRRSPTCTMWIRRRRTSIRTSRRSSGSSDARSTRAALATTRSRQRFGCMSRMHVSRRTRRWRPSWLRYSTMPSARRRRRCRATRTCNAHSRSRSVITCSPGSRCWSATGRAFASPLSRPRPRRSVRGLSPAPRCRCRRRRTPSATPSTRWPTATSSSTTSTQPPSSSRTFRGSARSSSSGRRVSSVSRGFPKARPPAPR